MTSRMAVDMAFPLFEADLVPFLPAERAQDGLLQDHAERSGVEAVAAASRQKRLMAALQADPAHALSLGRIADQHGAIAVGRRRHGELQELDLDLAVHAEGELIMA